MKPSALVPSLLAASLMSLAPLGAQAIVAVPALPGWTGLGDTTQQAGVLTLTTAYTLDDDAPFNLSGTPAADVAALEAAANLAPYALDLSTEHYATEGSIATQTITVQAGDVLSFKWSLTSQDALYPDHAFLVLGSQVITLGTALGAPSGPLSVTHQFTQGGSYLVGVGVVDVVDYVGVSTLTVSDVQITSVPEPTTAGLLLLGLATLGWAARRR